MGEINWEFYFILLTIFLVFRELVCWYWKQSEQVKLLKEIRNLLKNPQPTIIKPNKTLNEGGFEPSKSCQFCGHENLISAKKCMNCGEDLKKLSPIKKMAAEKK